jgi:ubiquinone/menaquinone biosynthesis C-methylase UbiE
VGSLMAVTNGSMNRLTAELLDVQPDDRILEIGFGPGSLIQMLASRALRGFVAGVDHSEVMVMQATRRNEAFVRAGRVEVKEGSVARLTFPDDGFTKVCAVNSFHLWPSPEKDLLEVRRVMKKGGLLLLCLRMRHPRQTGFMPPGFTEAEIEQVRDMLERAGFRNIRKEVRKLGREVTCLLANR